MKLTPSQQEAVDYRGSNLLVCASAGTGKTEVLARRCLSLLADLSQPCSVDRLLVVTFTRAAAAELRVRIKRMLRAAADETEQRELAAHLRRQEVLVDAADIGTIDAWCGRLVRSHSAEAGLDAEFTVPAEEGARLLRRHVLDELLVWVYTVPEPLAAAARGWLGRHSRPGDDFLRKLILRLNQYRDNLVDEQGWLAAQRALYTQDAAALRADAQCVLTAALARECAFQREQLAAIVEGAGSAEARAALAPLQAALADWTERLARPAAGELAPVAAEIEDFSLKKPRGLAEADQALLEEVKTRWLGRQLKERWSSAGVERILEAAPAAAQLMVTLIDLEQRYYAELAAAKAARAAYEFGDVLRMALGLLGTTDAAGQRRPTEIARRLQERYEHILVDEYQDTSPVQVEILRLVTRDAPGRSNRFMVGDVKQSIYGFRQAEPRLFTELTRAFESGAQVGRVKYLADNFRSHTDLVAGLNGLFAMLFDPALGGTAFDEREQLRAGRAELSNATLDQQPRIQVHVLEAARRAVAGPPDEEEAAPLERIEREAVVAAGMIRDLLAGATQVPERTAEDRLVLRPVRRSDIVILLRSARQNAAAVAGVLRRAGIPCLTSGRDALLDVPEVLDVYNALALLVNRRQDVPLAAYLRGPLVGLAGRELLQIRAASLGTDFWEAVLTFSECGGDGSNGLVAKVRAALRQLDRWSVAAREQELPELLRRILHDGGLLVWAAGLPGGEHRVALLRAIEHLAAEFSRQARQGVAEFVAYLEDLAGAELEPAVPVAAGEDAVRIMTIHAAKGLEFPIVLLVGAGSRFNLRAMNEPLQCDQAQGLGLKFYDYPARQELCAARHAVTRYETARRDVEEELRLLYVAATRAREQLYVFGHATQGAWEQTCLRYVERSGRPPLASRLAASGALEWVLMAVAAGHIHEAGAAGPPLVQVTVHAADTVHVSALGSEESHPIEMPPWTAEDQAWLQRGQTLLAARIDRSLSACPAVISVSALKELARSEREADVPRALGSWPVSLGAPAFAAPEVPDARDEGRASHRFLELADLTRLDSEAAVRQQLDELVAAGRLPKAAAGLVPVADVAWFGTCPTGRLVAAHAVTARRELPFVYALPLDRPGEAVILRGVIDCLLDVEAGLVLLDYKTDRVSGGAELAERSAGYAVQLQAYAQAAGAILRQPVSRTLLVFLRARQVAEVPCATMELKAIWDSLARAES